MVEGQATQPTQVGAWDRRKGTFRYGRHPLVAITKSVGEATRGFCARVLRDE